MPQEQATRNKAKSKKAEVKHPTKSAKSANKSTKREPVSRKVPPKTTEKTERSAMLRFVIDVHISDAEIQCVEVCTPNNVSITFYGAEQKTPILNVLADIERVAEVLRQAEILYGKPYASLAKAQSARGAK